MKGDVRVIEILSEMIKYWETIFQAQFFDRKYTLILNTAPHVLFYLKIPLMLVMTFTCLCACLFGYLFVILFGKPSLTGDTITATHIWVENVLFLIKLFMGVYFFWVEFCIKVKVIAQFQTIIITSEYSFTKKKELIYRAFIIFEN